VGEEPLSPSSYVSPSEADEDTDWGSEGLGRRRERSFGGVEIGEDLEDRRNLGSQNLASAELAIVLKGGMAICCDKVNCN